MKGRTPNILERKWMEHVRELGCVACSSMGYFNSHAAVHHCDGKTKPNAHFLTIGLCGRHHQNKDNNKPKAWISLHGDGKKVFQAEYGTERELMAKIHARLINLYGETEWLDAAKEAQEAW